MIAKHSSESLISWNNDLFWSVQKKFSSGIPFPVYTIVVEFELHWSRRAGMSHEINLFNSNRPKIPTELIMKLTRLQHSQLCLSALAYVEYSLLKYVSWIHRCANWNFYLPMRLQKAVVTSLQLGDPSPITAEPPPSLPDSWVWNHILSLRATLRWDRLKMNLLICSYFGVLITVKSLI